jgi:ketosteroid isomerase-like protein
MKTLLAAISLLFALQVLAEDHPSLAAVKAADKARVAAMQSGARAQLDGIFSDELRYAHSNGVVDTKASFIDILSAGKTKYVGYDYEEQSFTFPAPGIALMSGRAHVKAETAGGTMDSVLSFLAVWREENGKWRFLAWQSCKLPSAAK